MGWDTLEGYWRVGCFIKFGSWSNEGMTDRVDDNSEAVEQPNTPFSSPAIQYVNLVNLLPTHP